ncbi:glycosyl hydrolase family 28-related protein [Promicromonospora sp. NPDC059942]|uniref:glycosyl hydrolase family 28-related protein n=1 Tax=Promicromonospora sp. NPDC059942 TaxID=3347009 RepID=UPI00365B6D0C
MNAGRARVLATAAAVALTTAGLVAPAAAAPAAGPLVDVDRYPVGVGADLSATPLTHGIAVATAPTAGGQVTGEHAGRAYWRTDGAAGAGRLALDLADEYVGRLDGTPGYLVVDHRAGEAVVATAGGEPTPSGAPEADADGDGWTTTVVVLPAGTLSAGAAGEAAGAEVELAGADGELTVAAVRVVAQGTSVDLGPAVAERGIAVRAGDDTAGLVTGTADGRGYWQTGRAQGTNFVYANVSDAYARDVRDRVLVDATVQQGGGSMFLQYDSPGDTIPDMFRPSARLELADDGAWASRSWLLEDALLTNRSNGSDFRLSVEGSARDVRLDSLAVTVVPRTVDPAVGLRQLVRQADVAHFAAREGGRDGQFPAGSRAGLRTAIDAAQAVLDDPGASGPELNAATDALQDALEAFLAAERTTDLARGAAATASSTSGGTPGAVTDGTGSAWVSGRDEATAWVQVDLGGPTTLDEVLVDWTADYAHVYRVQVSDDGSTFRTVATAGSLGANPLRTRFEETTARYVRLALDELATQRGAYGLTALEVRDVRPVRLEPRAVSTVFPTDDVVVADLDATELGADPTGAEDSTAAIQEALATCRDAGGGTVWLPAGTYRVSDTLEVYAYCTLRGDHRDLDEQPVGAPGAPAGLGTVLEAHLPSGDDGPPLLRVGGSAGVVGLTTYYPDQDAADPVPYGWTVEVPGLAWIGNENYMLGTVQDLTFLNSYRGIGISTMRNDRGEGPGAQGHELANVRNVSGTVLYEGAAGYNGADVGVWEDVRLDNGYWASAGAAYGAPDRAVLDAWTRAHGTGFVLADLEWDQFVGLHAADYAVGIRLVKGPRASFTGVFVDAEIVDTDIAVLAENSDQRWGSAFASSTLEGSVAAVRNTSAGYVKLTDTAVSGALEGTVHTLDGPADVPQPGPARPAPKPADRLWDVTAAPYDVPRTPKQFSDVDATAGIQAALDDAGQAGGGVVYLPAGWYTVRGHLTVPAGVELRGSSAVPNRTSLVESSGTVLVAYEGRQDGTDDASVAEAAAAPAVVTLAGRDAGVRGLRVLHPENNPASDDGAVPYPFAVRGDAPGVYVENVGLDNAWNAVDLTDRADGFLVRRVLGIFLDEGVRVGAASDGVVDGVLSNGNVATRNAYGLPGPVEEANLFAQVIDGISREREVLVHAVGAQDLQVRNTFAYGSHDGIVATDGATVTAFNLGTDNLGPGGHTVDADASSAVTVVNLMRYNGTTSRGDVTIVNPMAINMATSALAVTADGDGTARVEGNEAEPGRYETGATVTAVADPAPGSRFAGWRDADGGTVSSASRYPFALTADTRLVATFEPAPETWVEARATTRCTGPKAQVVVRLRNTGPEALAVRLTSPFGQRQVAGLAPGADTRLTLPTRARSVAAGEVALTVTDDAGAAGVVALPYDAAACG